MRASHDGVQARSAGLLLDFPVSLGSLPSLILLPPLNLLTAAVAGALLGRRRVGRVLLAVGLAGLVILSLPIVSGSLLRLTELGLQSEPPPGAPPAAIVILSGDQQAARQAGATTWHVGALTLEREAAGAALARRTKLPVLVTGGAIHPWSPTLASLMVDSMDHDFGVPVRWQETRSQDTWDNARDTAAILRGAGITRVFVVTHAWHMRRALVAFRRAGMDPVPAPVLLDDVPQLHASAFLPSMHAWGESYFAIHELIGLAWYEIRP
jgi:uncharacterized SAM-binding protein YcdF (DUF218 family)